MLYTLSKAQYDLNELQTTLAQLTAEDRLVLWQDGVLLPIKYPQIFAQIAPLALANDVIARGLSDGYPCQQISLAELVEITERFYPQVGL
ncbi:hypothetical protein B0187_09755 [Haemophilus paracuniculus]|uniref:Sulfurtransferase TusB n=1 Tax=Haemophilus paracuniculus TaxID=734 RepID=A0A1T0APR1_9PAST|nr:DsrH/TusB family sulfur metabolism protein [Haemophilus paracuniculus]OOR98075.1 hypothetical protein B0187_09755 [Haemophilus paracuniculus]